MPLTKRLFRGAALAIVGVFLIVLSAPFVVSQGVRLWLSWEARQQNLDLKIDKISAPFLGPVVLREVHITSAPANAFSLDLKAAQATISLNLKNIILRRSGRAVRVLSIDGLRAETRRNHGGSFLSASGWIALQKILPSSVKLSSFDLRLEDGPTVILLRNASLKASEIESGQFAAGEVTIASPWFRQTFRQLRGATNWQGNRLTLAGLGLTRGLDLPWIAMDLSRLGQERADVDFDADAFGGKIRATITDEWREAHPTWNVVASVNDISLTQTSDALGFTFRIDGLVHAGKFTFHGDPRDPTHVTAWLWTELTDLKWRQRAAEIIMLGASLYNRQIEIQQLYVKQSKNQLTLSGQAALPAKSSDWLSPEFRGDVSASINELGDFAALFGANPGDFAGGIAIEGTVNTRDRKLGGHINFNGSSLTLFKTAIDSLNAKLNLKASELEIEQLELKRDNDSLSAQGRIDMSHEHHYWGSLTATVGNLADYFSILRRPTENTVRTAANIQAKIEADRWDAHGSINLAGSSPLDFTANLLLPIGTGWTALQTSPLNMTLEFPAIFLADAPQFFDPQIFHDGILTGKISLSESLRHPRMVGELQLINGKLENASLNLTEGSAHITFNGNQATIDFLNTATKDVDLALRGEIDFHDTNEFVITLVASTPMFDLTAQQPDCVNKIDIQPVAIALAPAVGGLEIRGTPSRSWRISLKEQTNNQAPLGLNLNQTARTFPFCLGQSAEEKMLSLGAPARPQPSSTAPHPKKRPRRR